MTAKTKLVPVPSPNMIPDRDIDKRPILECINLGITFGGLKAVEDFNLAIGRTEIAGLIGPNGAGKTTVFNLLTKVYQPTRGTILLDGNDTHDMDTAHVNRAGIARTFLSPSYKVVIRRACKTACNMFSCTSLTIANCGCNSFFTVGCNG